MKKLITITGLSALLLLSACSVAVEKDDATKPAEETTTSQEVKIEESNDVYNANIENGLKELDLVE